MKWYRGERDTVQGGETRSSHRQTWKHWIRVSSDRKELWCKIWAESTPGFTASKTKLNFLFQIWRQATAVMENKKADGKGWSSNKELCPTSRGESLKYARHHSNAWESTIMCSAMQRGCLSSNTPQLQHHRLAPAQPQEVLEISRRYGSTNSLLCPAACSPTHQSALAQLETFEIPGELLASDPQVFLLVSSGSLHHLHRPVSAKVIEEMLFLYRAGKDWARSCL